MQMETNQSDMQLGLGRSELNESRNLIGIQLQKLMGSIEPCSLMGIIHITHVDSSSMHKLAKFWCSITFCMLHIQAVFHKTGVWPFDPTVVTKEMMTPSKETSCKGHLPVVPSTTPMQVVAKLL